jgi:GAF domain-containing protein
MLPSSWYAGRSVRVGNPRSWSAEDYEILRQAQVYASGVLWRRGDASCQTIVERTAARFDVPIAMISILDRDRQWFPARIGIDLDESPREHAFCQQVWPLESDALYVTDARQDPRFAANPFVTGAPFVRFYAGVPLIVASGEPIGTLCVIDTDPRAAFAGADHGDLVALAGEALAAIEQVEARIEYGAEAIGLLVEQIRSAATAEKDGLVIELDRTLREVEQAMRLAGG